jgi:hypothetical protein
MQYGREEAERSLLFRVSKIKVEVANDGIGLFSMVCDGALNCGRAEDGLASAR